MNCLPKMVKAGLADVSPSVLSHRKSVDAGGKSIERTEADERVVAEPGPVGSCRKPMREGRQPGRNTGQAGVLSVGAV